MSKQKDRPYAELGAEIVKRRKQMGFQTQTDLAKTLGISTNTMGAIERGAQYPRKQLLNRLREVLWKSKAENPFGLLGFESVQSRKRQDAIREITAIWKSHVLTAEQIFRLIINLEVEEAKLFQYFGIGTKGSEQAQEETIQAEWALPSVAKLGDLGRNEEQLLPSVEKLKKRKSEATKATVDDLTVKHKHTS